MGSSIFVVQWERCDNCGLGKIPGGESYDVEPVVFSRFQSTHQLEAAEKGCDEAPGESRLQKITVIMARTYQYQLLIRPFVVYTTDEASDKHSHASGNCSTTDLTKQPTSMLSIWRPGLQRGTVESETEYNTEHHNNAPLMNRL
ncbi:hypothetical protein LWI28_028474 [Acer negundo]|uniref:Uncharacterized protein n=1 Tax=Acer negundo TaxID=4023 RepID=A0AAD5J8G5_ACENE|nr:hypothetical protein LWI28_028474 [Acer negundo]